MSSVTFLTADDSGIGPSKVLNVSENIVKEILLNILNLLCASVF
jgi:hypothetical protein